ncbi:MAG: hypothetical protein ACE5KS_01780 [Woeseiaceae bacterium]
MLRTFYIGIVLGVAAAAAAVYFYPVVDQHRESSLIVVHANIGNTESFHIRLPGDRIMAGSADMPESMPPGLEWPAYDFLSNIRAELFKVRNEKGVVIGAASRMYGTSELHGPFVEWAVHLPARGTMFVKMATQPTPEGHRQGTLRAGTREFLTLNGSVTERFVSDADDSDDDNSGRIELVAALVGPAVEYE